MNNRFSLLFVAIILASLLAACGLVQAPKAEIDVTPLHVGVKSLDKEPWEDCTVSINTIAGDMGLYRYRVGDVKPASENLIFLTQFSQKEGKRFIPILNKVTDVTLQCRYPSQPLRYEVPQG